MMGFHSIILLFACVFPLTLVHADGSESLLLDHCPYNDFCTRNRTNTDDIPSGYKPCCPTCYCDSACFRYRDCCPDVNMTSLSDTEMGHPVCLPAFHVTEYTESYGQRGIYQIRSCPVSYTTTSTDPDREMIKHKCEGGGQVEGLDEVLLVSNRHQHMEVFGNKYCAACNGVNDTIQWNLKIRDCNHDVTVLDGRPTLHLLEESFLNNCYVESVTPNDLQLPERVHCFIRRPTLSTCDPHSQWTLSGQADAIKEACEQSTHEHEFLTYDLETELTFVYPSYTCYLCDSGPDQTTPSDICKDDDDDTDDLMPPSLNPLTILLDGWQVLSLPRWSPMEPNEILMKGPTDPCSGENMYDFYTEQCVQLTCPVHIQFVTQHCVPIGQLMYGVEVMLRLMFSVQSRTTKAQSDISYDSQSIARLSDMLWITHLHVVQWLSTEFYDESYEHIQFVLMEFYLYTTQEHPVEHVVAIVKEISNRDIDWNVTIGEFVHGLRGNVVFLDNYLFNNTYDMSGGLIKVPYNTSILPLPLPPVLDRGLYVCPHVVYKVEDYCTLQEALTATPCTSPVNSFNIDAKLMRGCFVLTPGTFGYCIDVDIMDITTQVLDQDTNVDDHGITANISTTVAGNLTVNSDSSVDQATTPDGQGITTNIGTTLPGNLAVHSDSSGSSNYSTNGAFGALLLTLIVIRFI